MQVQTLEAELSVTKKDLDSAVQNRDAALKNVKLLREEIAVIGSKTKRLMQSLDLNFDDSGKLSDSLDHARAIVYGLRMRHNSMPEPSSAESAPIRSQSLFNRLLNDSERRQMA